MSVPGKLFQPNLMFAGKARSLPLSGAPEINSTLGWAPDIAPKHQTRLEKLAKDKHPNFGQKFVNYGQKLFLAADMFSFIVDFPVARSNIIKLFTSKIYEFSYELFLAESN